MTIRYERLGGSPRVFEQMTGIKPSEFEALVVELQPKLEENRKARASRGESRRPHGGGHPYELSPHDRILLSLVWIRHTIPQDVLGFLFGVSRSTVARTLATILPLLEAASGRLNVLVVRGEGARWRWSR